MLFGKHLLATIWLYSHDVEAMKEFYGRVLGMKLFDEHGGTVHFDGGGVRLSLHPVEEGEEGGWGFLVLIVEDGIQALCREMAARGISFIEELAEAEFGTTASFKDPAGNLLFVWQPPAPDDPRYAMVEPLVRHYRQVAQRLQSGN